MNSWSVVTACGSAATRMSGDHFGGVTVGNPRGQRSNRSGTRRLLSCRSLPWSLRSRHLRRLSTVTARRMLTLRAFPPMSGRLHNGHKLQKCVLNTRDVRAIPWPSGRWHARRRIDAGHAGRLHGREHARGHLQPRCRGGGGVGRGKGCRLRHRSGGGPPASRDAHGRGRFSSAQRTCARRAERPTRPMGGRVGLTAGRRGAPNCGARWRQQPPTCRRNRSRRAGTMNRASSRPCRTPEVAARGRRAQLGAVGVAGGQAPSGPCDPCGRTVHLSHVTLFASHVIATHLALTGPQIPEDTNAECLL